MKICPECGSTKFHVIAHVAQAWEVDTNGYFSQCIDECTEVIHKPDDDDIWCCAECGWDDPGSKFEFPDQPFIAKDMVKNGLLNGKIRLGNEDGNLSAHIGDNWFWIYAVAGNEYGLDEIIQNIYAAINEEPIRNVDDSGILDEEASAEYMYYFYALGGTKNSNYHAI